MLEALLARIAEGLDSRGIPYMLIGGQAVLLYGEPRLTRDVDVTLGAGPEQLPAVLNLAEQSGWKVLVATPQEFVARTLVLPCEEHESGIRIDFIFTFSPFEQQAIERARLVQVGGAQVRFATPEDLIIYKVMAGRPRDLDDVRSILRKNPALDWRYVRRWLKELQEGHDENLLARFNQIHPD
jgi:predicted nucleotidyltransferase